MATLKEQLEAICDKYAAEAGQTYRLTQETFDVISKKLSIAKQSLTKYDVELLRKTVSKFTSEGDEKEETFNEEEERLLSEILDKRMSEMHIRALLNMSHIYLITLLEAFNKDFFMKTFASIPKIMVSKNQISYGQIIGFESIEELHQYLAAREVERAGYQNIDELAAYLNKRVGIDLEKGFGKWDELRENYYRRNIIVHNSGKISEIYAQKLKKGEGLVGDEIKNDISYIRSCFHNVSKYLIFIKNQIFTKFRL